MRDLRIVFMGTPDFAVYTLQSLFEHGYCIAGVVTAPDKPAGRGRKIRHAAVKNYAVSKNMEILQPKNLKSDAFIKALSALHANLYIVVAFRMLPKVVWEMPLYGTFNLHASLLPDYRGAAPINWVIINGEDKTGVTTFFIDEKIDTGAIILQESVAIGPKTTAGVLHDQLMVIGAALVLKTVELIKNNNVHPIQQKATTSLKTAHKIHKDTCRIDWTKPMDTIYNLIRGLSPYPTAWTILKKEDEEIPIKIYEADKEQTTHFYDIGMIICSKQEIKVAVQEGFIHIKELQLPGRRRMSSSSVLNGYEFPAHTKVL